MGYFRLTSKSTNLYHVTIETTRECQTVLLNSHSKGKGVFERCGKVKSSGAFITRPLPELGNWNTQSMRISVQTISMLLYYLDNYRGQVGEKEHCN